MTHSVQRDDEGRSFFTLDVDFPVAPLELPASATVLGRHSGEMTGETGTGSGDCRMTPGAIRVAVVDDQPLLVSAFSALVDAQPDMEVVLEAVNGRQGVDSLTARARDPQSGIDLVLMDLRMPVLDGVSAIRELRTTPATTTLRILVLTTFDDDDLVLAALGAGAHGFLLKDAEPMTLLEAIRIVARGGPGWTRLSPAPFWRTLMQVPDLVPRSRQPRRRDRLMAPCPSSGHRRDPTRP